jgi:hypothetical protein
MNVVSSRLKRNASFYYFAFLPVALLLFADSNAAADGGAGEKLIQLAQMKFTNDITANERKMFQAAANGEVFDTNSGDASLSSNPPNSSVARAATNTIRSDRLGWLCTDSEASKLITPLGIRISGMSILGDFDLGSANVLFPLGMHECTFPDGISLEHAHLISLDLGGSWVSNHFRANYTKIDGSLYLDHGFQASVPISLYRATIGDDLICDDGNFNGVTNVEDYATFDAAAINIGKQFSFRRVHLIGILDCGDAEIEDVDFTEATITGSINFALAKIKGEVHFQTSHVLSDNSQTPALDAAQSEIAVLRIKDSQFRGVADLSSANISKYFDCSGSYLSNTNSDWYALEATHAVFDSFRIENSTISGGINLLETTVNSDILIENGYFINHDTNKTTVNIGLSDIKGSLFFGAQNFVEGRFSIVGANIAHLFAMDGEYSLGNILMDLRSAKVGNLLDTSNSWPVSGRLLLNNFVYDQMFDDAAPVSVASRIKWLHLQPGDHFISQPYVQLAEYYRKSGQDEAAAQVMIAKNDDYSDHLPWYSLSHLWYGLIGKLVGYGYKTGRAFGISLIFIIVGTFVFSLGHRHNLILPSEEKAYSFQAGILRVHKGYPIFNPFIYSLEMFVPLVKLGMEDVWRPSAERGHPLFRNKNKALLTTDGVLRCYLWIHILAGWVLTTLWVGGLTGLVKT